MAAAALASSSLRTPDHHPSGRPINNPQDDWRVERDQAADPVHAVVEAAIWTPQRRHGDPPLVQHVNLAPAGSPVAYGVPATAPIPAIARAVTARHPAANRPRRSAT
ncbi:MAG: hypothetical protein N3D77_00560 [Geminicoccaceae bacterium]|nr:hypothetical protein [Geminicoccaceae bacterium]